MWNNILEIIHIELKQSLTNQYKIERLDRIFELLKFTENIQSEPAETAPILLDTAKFFFDYQGVISEIGNRLKTKSELSVEEWLLLSYLVMLLESLESGWEQFYKIIFSVYKEVGQYVEKIRDFLRELPFSEGLQKLATEWTEPGTDTRFDIAALLYIRACALAKIYGNSSIYEKISNNLAFDKKFLLVFLSAACLKVDGVTSKIDISEWSDSQSACLSMMDNFYFLPGYSWG